MRRAIGFLTMTVACGGAPSKDAPTPEDGDPTSQGDTDTVPTADCGVAFVETPALRGGDDPLFPLSRAISAHLTAPASLEITATDAEGEQVTWLSPTATDHDVALVGLHADATWTVSVVADDGVGCRVAADPIAETTGPLPSPLPNIDVLVADTPAISPGLTVVPLYSQGVSYITMLDDAGRICWIYGPTPEKFTEVRPLADGHLLALTDYDILEIDAMGVVRTWSSQRSQLSSGIPVAVPEFHHDVLLSSRNTLVTLTKGTARIQDFPLSYDDPTLLGPADVAQDIIVELDLDGTILRTWDVTRMLDTGRLGFNALDPSSEGYEWSHVNAIDEDVTHDRWIVSARNQDVVFAVNEDDSSIDWMLGNHDNWHEPWSSLLLDPIGAPFSWQYHQHAVKYAVADGRVMVFDNGNARASPWTDEQPLSDSETWSRIVQYSIDERSRTVAQDWEFRLDPDLFSFAMGDADWLPNGDVLADFAYVEYVGGVENEALGRGNNTVRIVEFDPATGERVWDVDIWSALEDEPNAWQAYRVQRIPRPFVAGAATTGATATTE